MHDKRLEIDARSLTHSLGVSHEQLKIRCHQFVSCTADCESILSYCTAICMWLVGTANSYEPCQIQHQGDAAYEAYRITTKPHRTTQELHEMAVFMIGPIDPG
jgi:hypothetical protein